jgi:S-adenosylmethionine:tRNA ribosyltransferase-isomerase
MTAATTTCSGPCGADLDFELPEELEAHSPPPGGLEPGSTRMLVAYRSAGTLRHARLADLPCVLEPGDLVVVNDSATLPAAVDTTGGLRAHLSGTRPDGSALVELREAAGPVSRPSKEGQAGQRLALPGGGSLRLRERQRGGRLWVADLDLPGGLVTYLARHGQPIRYGQDTPAWPLDAAQTTFASRPGSAEAPSAALAFDRTLVGRLRTAGIGVTTITLHAGVASLEEGEPPYPERFHVPAATAAAVRDARRDGRRVVAVGTTVTRALESAWRRGAVLPTEGWTDLVIDAVRGVRVVDGLLTGWHEPRASHLDLLEAVGGHDLLAASYAEALSARYRWHTFGDLHLVLR